jgi:hypothetical protein
MMQTWFISKNHCASGELISACNDLYPVSFETTPSIRSLIVPGPCAKKTSTRKNARTECPMEETLFIGQYPGPTRGKKIKA